MAHSVAYNPEYGLIEMKVEGRLDQTGARRVVSDIVHAAKEHDCYLVLSDYRELTHLDLSTVEIYNMPDIIREISEASGVVANQFKRALIVPETLTDFAFFETVTLNRGQVAKLFHSPDDARKWLCG